MGLLLPELRQSWGSDHTPILTKKGENDGKCPQECFWLANPKPVPLPILPSIVTPMALMVSSAKMYSNGVHLRF